MIHEATASRTKWREQAIAATRRRLRRLEIEAHRIKAELARLESENETDIADELSLELRQNGVDAAGETVHIARPRRSPALLAQRSVAQQSTVAVVKPEEKKSRLAQPTIQAAPIRPRATKRRRPMSRAFWLSLGVHAAVFAFIAPMTFVVLTNDQIPLFASMFEFEAPSVDEPGAMPIELVSFDEVAMPDAALVASVALAETLAEEFTPLDSAFGQEPASNLGELNSLPTDVGTLMAGGGSGTGNGRSRSRGAGDVDARLGMTSFFGTPAQANCVVFVVDNSGSMKQGRMETTLFELARSVEALSEKQRFYVVFYSDQAYPMLYPNSVMEPLAATSENKRKLFDWLQTVELCQGGALLKAMEIAASLKPQVVYVLSDGDITGTVTMQRLTQPSDRNFPVHTLGMGVAKPQDAQNLLAIAQANRGTFQMVRPLPAAVQSAKLRPIRSNVRGVAWGEWAMQLTP